MDDGGGEWVWTRRTMRSKALEHRPKSEIQPCGRRQRRLALPDEMDTEAGHRGPDCVCMYMASCALGGRLASHRMMLPVAQTSAQNMAGRVGREAKTRFSGVVSSFSLSVSPLLELSSLHPQLHARYSHCGQRC